MIKTTENCNLVLYKAAGLFLPAHLSAKFLSSLVEVKLDNKIIFPLALSYGNKDE